MNPAANGPLFSGVMPTNQDKAQIYFYRPLENDGGTVCLKVLLNDVEKGCLGTTGFLGFYAKAGDYRVKIKPDAFPTHTLLEFDVNISRNDQRLFKISIANSSDVPKYNEITRYTPGGTWFIKEMPFSYAQQELSKLNESIGP
ncbi:hypothetical protein J8L84_19570 [Alteromonas sp. MMG017]|uniref:hypothetical protein n=1 Tax=Alteromonas sp. MMG017 TaxID=2822692 RepID=UPI001B39DE6C|nr:hypothetical protein [Alteromonas sp. MMG017]MBQ4831486.1 hypothetical protein [Alteromonas sp. MMG017]